MSQLLPITHEIFKDFDANPLLNTCGIFFFYISKAFDRVWHEALAFKLWSYRISDSLLCLFNSFLSERLQKVVLNGQASEWWKVLAGVSQEYRVFLECNVKILTDDASFFSLVRDPNES